MKIPSKRAFERRYSFNAFSSLGRDITRRSKSEEKEEGEKD